MQTKQRKINSLEELILTKRISLENKHWSTSKKKGVDREKFHKEVDIIKERRMNNE